MITHNEIYTYLEGKINKEGRPVYVTGRYEPVPVSFPSVYIEEASHVPVADAVQLDHKDKQTEQTWELQICSNSTEDALGECYEILADVEDAMRDLHFTQVSYYITPNLDSSVVRISTRFRRVIAESDTLPVEL